MKRLNKFPLAHSSPHCLVKYIQQKQRGGKETFFRCSPPNKKKRLFFLPTLRAASPFENLVRPTPAYAYIFGAATGGSEGEKTATSPLS